MSLQEKYENNFIGEICKQVELLNTQMNLQVKYMNEFTVQVKYTNKFIGKI